MAQKESQAAKRQQKAEKMKFIVFIPVILPHYFCKIKFPVAIALKILVGFCLTMLSIFTKLADLCISWMGLSLDSSLGTAVHFFIEDSTKIFVLIYILIFVFSLWRCASSISISRK